MSQFTKYLEIIQETKLHIGKMKEKKEVAWYFQYIPELKIEDDISKKFKELLDENNKRAFFKMQYRQNSNSNKKDLIININPENQKNAQFMIREYKSNFDIKYWNYNFKPPINISSIKKSKSLKGYGEITKFEIKEPITINSDNLVIRGITKGTVLFYHEGINYL